VLGPSGRNFGAGMSGGVAFAYDADGRFGTRVNPEMVDLDPLDDDDRLWLLDRVEQHVLETESALAQRMLDNWDDVVGRFVKVMPRDYKRVLMAERQAAADGTDPLEAIMAASRAG
jgi:glutamate synthase (NADPH) large chain